MKREVTLYLSDIAQNMDDAVGFVAAMQFADFARDKKTINAVVRSLEIVGEAAKHVPEEIRARAPAVPWRSMAGMRDLCIHAYMGVDCEMVWNVVKNDIPRMRPKIQALLDDLRKAAQD